MDALLAFAASLMALRLAAELVRRHTRTRAPELAWWAASLAAFAVASAALAWGSAAGWDDRSFRLYSLAGGLLTAAACHDSPALPIALRTLSSRMTAMCHAALGAR